MTCARTSQNALASEPTDNRGRASNGGKSRGRSLAIDSHIEGFETLARLAADAAAARGLELDPTTRSNFAAMEVVLPQPAGALERAR